MVINLNIKKKDLWLLSAIMVFLIAIGYVVAIGSNNYQVQGHDFSELQKCAANLVLKADASGNWQCSSDVKCDASGACAQVCIGSDCRAIWPTAVQATTCLAGQYATSVSSAGIFGCTVAHITAGNCVYSGRNWGLGARCCQGSHRYLCGPTGAWTNTGSSCGSWPAC